MNALKDEWLPAVDREFETLLNRTRDIGANVGDLFCIFDKAVRKGVRDFGPSSAVCGSGALYVRYEGQILMCFAVCGKRIAIVKWAELGSEAQQRRELDDAKARATQLFP